MRDQIAAGNWKMNLDHMEAVSLANAIVHSDIPENVQVILGVPYVYLAELSEMCSASENVHVAAQNCHQENSGAYTGEISVDMLLSLGVNMAIIGHSERREYFNESDELLKSKVDQVLNHDMTVIFCCGEPQEVREAGEQNDYVAKQLENSLFHLEASHYDNIIIAYEPIWAIGTGLTASPEQAQEMHAFIRSRIKEKYGAETADSISILYGGSVKAANASELFANADVDGGLVGGASLDAESFSAIISSF